MHFHVFLDNKKSNDGSEKTKKSKEMQNFTKMGFLEMIKNKGSTKEEGHKSSSPKKDEEIKTKENSTSKTSSGWNALKEDYMMNSKLKDWDKDLSSSSEEENE